MVLKTRVRILFKFWSTGLN